MDKLPLKILLRLAACLAFTWFVWRVLELELFAVIFCAPAFAMALARPLAELLDQSGRLARRVTWGEVDGRHFAHRGYMIDVLEDEDFRRWLHVGDVRRLLTGLPADAVLQRLHPDGFRPGSRSNPGARILAESLHEFLQRATDADTLKFRLWLQRQVVEPAQRRRERAPGRTRGKAGDARDTQPPDAPLEKPRA